MREFKGIGLVITLLVSIAILFNGCDEDSNPVVETFPGLEKQAFDLVNQYRVSKGLSALEWNDAIAEECRKHSRNMASGTVEFGHGGWEDRAARLFEKLDGKKFGENVAYNFNFADPAQKAYEGWLNSTGHLAIIETPEFNTSAMGVAQSSDGKYYFTQIFIQK